MSVTYGIIKTKIEPINVTTEVTLTMSRKVALDLRFGLSKLYTNHYLSTELRDVMRFLDTINAEFPQ